MSQLSSADAALARRRHGLVTTAQLTASGVSPYRRRRLLEAGTLQLVHSGVHRSAAVPATFERVPGRVPRRPGARHSGPSAGRLLKLRRMPIGPVHVMIRSRSVELDGVVVHRTNALADVDVTCREDGIRTLSPARLVFDLARFLDDDDLSR